MDRGSGLLGLRTENSEVYSTSTTQWWIGQSGIDTPDNFTTKAVLISGLTNIRNGLNGMVSLFKTTLAMLQSEGRAILDEFKVELPVGDISSLDQAVSQFQNFSSEIQGCIDYFNQYSDPSPSEDRSTINARLESTKTYVKNIIGEVNNRCEGIPALMGNASSGLNKQLTHWVSEVVKKPDGPYAMILGSRDMLAMAEANIQKKDENLNFFEQDYDRWMEPTLIQSIYDRVALELDQTIKQVETDIMWNLIQSANKYKVLSKPFSELPFPLSNAEWDEPGVWVANKLESGFLNNTLTIAPPTESTMFRIISFDTDEGYAGDFQRLDSFNTKSKQTDIISDDLPFIQQPDERRADGVMRSVVSFNNEKTAKQINERDFLWLNESEIAQIIGVSDSNYMLDTDYGTITSLRKLTGLYYVAPIEPQIEEFRAE
jgi:hypothetical protein